MDFNLDDNIIWILVILAVVFFLFSKNEAKKEEEVEEKVEEKNEECGCIYRRSKEGKVRRRLVYN